MENHPSGLTDDQIYNLEAQFAGQQTLINLSCIPTGIAFVFLAHAALIAANRWFINSDGITGYRVPYQPVIWWFFPGFGALCLCFEISLQIWALFVGHTTVNLYSEWDSRQPKKARGGIAYYDARKVLRWFTVLIAIPIGILSGLALRMHTTFSNGGIHAYGYAFAAPVFHSYADLRRVTLLQGVRSKHGKLIDRPSYVLDFADGHRWSQTNWDDSAKSIQRSLATILSQHSNLPIGNVTAIEDLRLLDSPR
jgi:hypothetical protein